jgi:CIC family chloride channel protein
MLAASKAIQSTSFVRQTTDKESTLQFRRKAGYIPIVEASIVGAVAGFSAVILEYSVSWLGKCRLECSALIGPHCALPLFGLMGGLFAGLLVEFVAPEIAGSGIPQVRAALDRVKMRLDLKVGILKLLGGVVSLGSGLFMGREGPTVQLGASLAATLSRFVPTTPEHRRQLIAAGAGAGLAAAFNAPLAGITFVVEELLRDSKPATILITTFACASASLCVNFFWTQHLRTEIHTLAPEISFTPPDIPFYLLLGALCGILSALFNAGIMGSLWIHKNVLRFPVSLKVGLAGLLSGTLISLLPSEFYNYAAVRGLIITGEMSAPTVLVAFCTFYFLAILAYGSGAPGGLFAPAMALGSAIGYLVGCGEHSLIGTGSASTFALVGMGAFFAGVVRVPLTAIVITFELTTSFTTVIPLMIASVTASIISDYFYSGSIYDRLMSWNGINLRSSEQATEALTDLKAQDVMRVVPECLSGNASLKSVLPKFSLSVHRGFPVLEGTKLIGVVTQTDVGHVLQLPELSEKTLVAEVMTKNPVSVSPYDSLEEILFLFSRYKFTWLPVCELDVLKGVITQSDVVQALFSELQNGKEKIKDDKGTAPVTAIVADDQTNPGELGSNKKDDTN